MEEILIIAIEIIIGIVVVVAILRQPYLGVAFTLATQPIVDLLPKIPLVSSVAPLIGILTILALLIKAQSMHIKGASRLSATHLITLLLVVWIFISNPTASWFGQDRNWVLTFIQLFILMWLTGFLLDSPEKHRTLMWIFSLLTLVTAFVAITQGGFLEEIDPEVRAAGLTQGANTAARYFTVTFVFLNYLRTTTKNNLVRLISIIGMIVTFLGVFYTVSRTGMLLLGIAIILMFLMQPSIKYRTQLIIIAFLGFSLILIFSGSILGFMKEIVPSIQEGTDTVGLRYALWEAGWEMWKDHPITGVGIGMFKFTLSQYPSPEYSFLFRKGLVAHNMYVSMLAETGLIGFLLFILLLILSVRNIFISRKRLDPKLNPIANVWLIVLVALLIGGLTKTDQVDKLLWLVLGTSIFFNNQAKTWSHSSRKITEVPKRLEKSIQGVAPAGLHER